MTETNITNRPIFIKYECLRMAYETTKGSKDPKQVLKIANEYYEFLRMDTEDLVKFTCD